MIFGLAAALSFGDPAGQTLAGAMPVLALDINEHAYAIDALKLVQAYIAADASAVFGKGTKTTVTAGRFILNLGSRRLVAADDYRNTINGYIGLRSDIAAPGGSKANFIYTMPQVRLPQASRNPKHWPAIAPAKTITFEIWRPSPQACSKRRFLAGDPLMGMTSQRSRPAPL